MGANQSSAETRSVSMDNPTPSGVIDVSDEVVQRLKLGISKAKQQEKQEAKKPETARAVPITEPKRAPPAPAAAPSPSPSVIPKPAIAPAPLPKTTYSNPTPAAAAMSPYPRLAGEPTVTAMEMRRQKEIELRENDQIWRTRIAKLEQTLNKTNDVMEKEYSAAIEDVRKRFANVSGIHQLPPCQDLKAQLIACYRAYPNETLKCAEEVAMFRNCVAVHRIKRLDSEQQPAAKGA
ncbi:MICOS complex subunit mic25a [Episyrphus balteatus]|uniref:MICOS complex subunit mic25a n=1 Tax=Episyrphus balteatus TaxID=286459 RepID=UPI0024850D4D|nr:MICOS complex subunit mic25a [Episyrphus balteatus]